MYVNWKSQISYHISQLDCHGSLLGIMPLNQVCLALQSEANQVNMCNETCIARRQGMPHLIKRFPTCPNEPMMAG